MATRVGQASTGGRALQGLPYPEPMRSRLVNRWFAEGSDPDPRFTLANERTFLAWVRTSLALLAGGIGLDAFVVGLPGGLLLGDGGAQVPACLTQGGGGIVDRDGDSGVGGERLRGDELVEGLGHLQARHRV